MLRFCVFQAVKQQRYKLNVHMEIKHRYQHYFLFDSYSNHKLQPTSFIIFGEIFRRALYDYASSLKLAFGIEEEIADNYTRLSSFFPERTKT
jgi:hypothetical protein